jgi:hypothetical protein
MSMAMADDGHSDFVSNNEEQKVIRDTRHDVVDQWIAPANLIRGGRHTQLYAT